MPPKVRSFLAGLLMLAVTAGLAGADSPEASLVVERTRVVFEVAAREWRSDPVFTVTKDGVERTPDGERAIRLELRENRQPSYVNGPNFPVGRLQTLRSSWRSLSFWVKPDDSGAKANVTFVTTDEQGAAQDHVFIVPLAGRGWQKLEFTAPSWSRGGSGLQLHRLSHMLVTIPGKHGVALDFLLGPLTFQLGAPPLELRPLPVADVPSCSEEPTIDGALEDPAWAGATVITAFADLKDGVNTGDFSEVRLTCGANALYVAARQRIDPDKLVRQQQTRQMDVWRDDSLCFFLSPNNDGRTYYQFLVNSLGVIQGTRNYFDRIKDDFTFDGRWEGRWSTAAAIGPDGWSVELAIPFDCMTPAMEAGGLAGCQIGFINPSLRQTSSWAPVSGSSFLEPARFGVLNLIGRPGPKAVLDRASLRFEKLLPQVSLSCTPGAATAAVATIVNDEGAMAQARARIDGTGAADLDITGYVPKGGSQRLTIALDGGGTQRAVHAFLSSPVTFVAQTPLDVDVLCPRPKAITAGTGRWRPVQGMRIYCPRNPARPVRLAAERLRDDLLGYLQVGLPIEEADLPALGLLIATAPDAVRWDALPAPTEGRWPGGYALAVTPSAVAMAGTDGSGLYHAATTLAQLERYAFLRNGDSLPETAIRDWPSIPTRVFFHWFQGFLARNSKVAAEDLRSTEYKLVDRYIGDLKLNAFSLLAPEAIRYDGEANRKVNAYPKGILLDIPGLKELRRHCEDRAIEFIPALCGPSHALWMTLPYPELVMPGYSNWDADPTHERFFQVYFPIMDELLSTGATRRFAIWNDEWWHQPRGAFSTRHHGIEKRDIFRTTVERIHGHLQERGVQTVMFSDMLQKAHNGGIPYDNHLNAPLLPKDLVLAHWSNGRSAAAEFAALGYAENWLVTNRFTPHRVAPAEIAERRIHGCGIIAYNSLTPDTGYGYGPNLRVADHAWNLGIDDNMSLADWMLVRGRNVMANSSVLRNPAAARTFRCVDLGGIANTRSGRLHPGLERLQRGAVGIAAIPTRIAAADGLDCAMPASGENLTVAIGGLASSLIFLHAHALPKEKRSAFLSDKNNFDYSDGVRIGSYLIRYGDGSTRNVHLRSAENIGDLVPYAGLKTGVLENTYLADCRHTLELGEAGSGAPCLYQSEWVNPCPEKTIESLGFTSAGLEAAPVLFAITAREVRAAMENGR